MFGPFAPENRKVFGLTLAILVTHSYARFKITILVEETSNA